MNKNENLQIQAIDDKLETMKSELKSFLVKIAAVIGVISVVVSKLLALLG